MHTFQQWLVLESLNPQQVINAAQTGRKNGGICDRSHFGDCKDIVKETLEVLKAAGIPAFERGGTFVTKRDDNLETGKLESWEHSWIQISRWILDPTVDQFFSELDVDMRTRTPGIYFSHPSWDGDSLRLRYKTVRLPKIKLGG